MITGGRVLEDNFRHMCSETVIFERGGSRVPGCVRAVAPAPDVVACLCNRADQTPRESRSDEPSPCYWGLLSFDSHVNRSTHLTDVSGLWWG